VAEVSPKLTIPFTVGTGQIVGQGNFPELWVLYSESNANATPVWSDATSKVKSFSVSRGRETEVVTVAAGTATVTLDNHERDFDPDANPGIRPINRWWIRVQFSGATEDIFKGYADSYDQVWPAPVGDAETVVQCTDEFKVLTLDSLPVTSPPRDTYGGVVESDNPAGYWPLDDDPSSLVQAAKVPDSPPRGIDNPGVGAPPPIVVDDPWFIRGPWPR
jgi:hypothetical protein